MDIAFYCDAVLLKINEKMEYGHVAALRIGGVRGELVRSEAFAVNAGAGLEVMPQVAGVPVTCGTN